VVYTYVYRYVGDVPHCIGRRDGMYAITNNPVDWVVCGLVALTILLYVVVYMYRDYRNWMSRYNTARKAMDDFTYSSQQAQQGRTTN
jgi:uncharacterized membrane protein